MVDETSCPSRCCNKCDMYRKRVEELERFCKGQSSIIDRLEKNNAELSDRVVKAEKLMS